MEHKISIALCTYNGSKYLASQLESYLAQSQPPDEVVVCDDCSRDETVLMLNEFAGRAPFPMRIFVNEQNIGSTKNFEKAISRCSGDIIFLSDQDDVWAPDKIERVANEFNNDYEVGMVFSNAELVDETLQPLGSNLSSTLGYPDILRGGGGIKGEDLLPRLLIRDLVVGNTLAFRTKYNKTILPIPTDIPHVIHDNWIAIVLSMSAISVFIDEPLVKYRQHTGQQIGLSPARHDRHIFNLGEITLLKSPRIRLVENLIREKESVELIKSHIIQRIDVADCFMDAMNAEIDRRLESARHFRLRQSLLSDKHIMRIRPVIKELFSGRYHRYSNGIRSAAGDLMAFVGFQSR
jgi:glycosyltransferase involved in cell wall biosynthesis